MQELVAATGMPMVLHGGTGLTAEVYQRLISLGAAKVNISTALKKTYADGFRTYLEERPTEYDPLKLIGAVRQGVIDLARPFFELFGSAGQA
jgi:fructose/tagatose bisphosphate aldolase